MKSFFYHELHELHAFCLTTKGVANPFNPFNPLFGKFNPLFGKGNPCFRRESFCGDFPCDDRPVAEDGPFDEEPLAGHADGPAQHVQVAFILYFVF